MNAMSQIAALSLPLNLAAVRALDASVNERPDAREAIDAFREQFHRETGISRELLYLLIAEGVLA